MELTGERRRVLPFMAGLILFVAVFTAAAYLVSVVMTNYFSELTEGERMIPVSGESLPVIVIDPGHGGEDGGSTSGEVTEKELNLAVGECIYRLAVLTGHPAKLTRRSDVALYDLYGDLADYAGKKKAYDLRNRVRFASDQGGVYLGIHMNKFPDPSVSGLQVWYSPNDPRSAEFAKEIQDAAIAHLSEDCRRETKRADSSIFVLDRLEIPAVLTECGFISNPEELSRLTDPAYRRLLSCVVFSAAARFVSGGAS